jgi:CO/xanthine dehydrogenase Mo-binding subunit
MVQRFYRAAIMESVSDKPARSAANPKPLNHKLVSFLIFPRRAPATHTKTLSRPNRRSPAPYQPPGVNRLLVEFSMASAHAAFDFCLNAAVVDACRQIKERLAAIPGAESMTFAQTLEAAYKSRVALFAQGYYRTPEIHFDPKTATGSPFHYFAYGAAVSEVEVDGFTGEYRTLRTDILHDVGDSISPAIDRGQIEGGFAQGVGWLTLEELLWDAEGRVATAGASTYKLPSWAEMPPVFEVAFLDRATEPGVVFGSKAVGEPPLMLEFSVREAIRAAIAAFGAGGQVIALNSPATPECVFRAIQSHTSAADSLHATASPGESR